MFVLFCNLPDEINFTTCSCGIWFALAKSGIERSFLKLSQLIFVLFFFIGKNFFQNKFRLLSYCSFVRFSHQNNGVVDFLFAMGDSDFVTGFFLFSHGANFYI